MQHAIGVYSVCAHLAPGSVEVAEGQWVRQGTRIGLCGNSGRSFRPHLHFQVQGTPRVGAPTMEADFFDCVTEGADAPMLHRSIFPEEDAVVRNIERKEDVAGLFAWPIGTRVRFRYTGFRGRVREEEIVSGIDLYNNLFLESRESGARLYFENMNRQFLVYDYFGPRRSSLYLLYAAAPRVPFDCPHGLKWDDALSRRHFRARWISWLVDFVDPFLPLLGLKLDFTASTDGGGLAVTGRGKVGRQPLATRAVFTVGAGLAEASLEIGGAAAKASLVEVLGEGQ
jgi:murein DD-endopeptidase MepM/ murein hydrolase activator NlpD